MKNCVKCHSQANMMCSKCFDPYCSITCQRSDWYDHKKICHKLPDLVPIEELLRATDLNSKNETALVSFDQAVLRTITFQKSPSDVLLESLHRSSTTEIPKPSKGTSQPTEMVKETQKISIDSELRPIKADNSLQKSPKPQFGLHNFKCLAIQQGKKIPLLVIDTSQLKQFVIAVLDCENKAQHKMANNLKKLTAFCKIAEKTDTGYNPQTDEICLAVFEGDGEWYRALVIEEIKKHSKYTVLFIDYGNISEVSSNNIMPITEDFMFPTCTNLCTIKNIKEIDLPKVAAYIDKNPIIICDVSLDPEIDMYDITFSNADVVLK